MPDDAPRGRRSSPARTLAGGIRRRATGAAPLWKSRAMPSPDETVCRGTPRIGRSAIARPKAPFTPSPRACSGCRGDPSSGALRAADPGADHHRTWRKRVEPVPDHARPGARASLRRLKTASTSATKRRRRHSVRVRGSTPGKRIGCVRDAWVRPPRLSGRHEIPFTRRGSTVTHPTPPTPCPSCNRRRSQRTAEPGSNGGQSGLGL